MRKSKLGTKACINGLIQPKLITIYPNIGCVLRVVCRRVKEREKVANPMQTSLLVVVGATQLKHHWPWVTSSEDIPSFYMINGLLGLSGGSSSSKFSLEFLEYCESIPIIACQCHNFALLDGRRKLMLFHHTPAKIGPLSPSCIIGLQ